MLVASARHVGFGTVQDRRRRIVDGVAATPFHGSRLRRSAEGSQRFAFFGCHLQISCSAPNVRGVRLATRCGSPISTTPLCAPSMGAVLMGFKSPVRESNMRRKDHGKHKPRSRSGRQLSGWRKTRQEPQADEQEPHTRPTGRGELAQHSEAVRPSPGGKWGCCAAEDRVLTWGDPEEEMPREVSRGHSTEQRAGGGEPPVETKIPEDSMPGRAEPMRNRPTTGRTFTPITPVGEARTRAALTGSMG